ILASAACSKSAASELDPAKVGPFFKAMAQHMPLPGGVRTCKYEEMLGGATLTRRTFLQLANEKLESRPENDDFVNPAEIESPAARELVDPSSSDDVKRK